MAEKITKYSRSFSFNVWKRLAEDPLNLNPSPQIDAQDTIQSQTWRARYNIIADVGGES